MASCHLPTRGRFLVLYGVDAKRFAARFGIEPFSAPCCSCGSTLKTSLPFVSGKFRGLISPRCSCGNDLPPYCVVMDPRFGDLLDGHA